MKKIWISGVVIALIVPQIALASWWNPISWFRKQPAQTATQGQLVKTATSTATEIEDLQKRIDDLKKQQPVVVPATATSVIKKKTEKIVPSVNNSETTEAQVQAQVEATLKAKADQEAVVAKQKADEQTRIDLANAQLAKQIAEQTEINRIQLANTQAVKDAELLAQQQAALQALQVKKEKLNAINQQIADLNAKYAVDTAAVYKHSFGGPVTTAVYNNYINYNIDKLNTQYKIDYNTLMSQYQQIQYSN